MTLNQLKKAASIYIDREFTSKMDGLGKWVLGVGAGAYLSQLDGLFNNYKDMLCKMGMCQPDGNIDIEKAYTLIKEEAVKQGKVTQNIPVVGPVTFSPEDVDTFYRICKEVM
jgi:rRNA maturation protein Nop10